MSLQADIIQIINDVLMLDGQTTEFDSDTGLLGSIPEFDSIAVVSLVTALEARTRVYCRGQRQTVCTPLRTCSSK